MAMIEKAPAVSSIATQHRRLARTRHACEPCKARKRKCSGQQSCFSCSRFEYDCYFSSDRGKMIIPKPGTAVEITSVKYASGGVSKDSDREAIAKINAGLLFPATVGLKLNSTRPPSVRGLGWNVGLHYRYSPSPAAIVWILTKDEWHVLFATYRREIHRIYDFMDLEMVLQASAGRWDDPDASNEYDHVLAGIAALGSLFSKSRDEGCGALLVECAKEILDSTSLVANPTFLDVQAWVLRTLYLRCNAPPHAAWMASCITMHVAEAVGAQVEAALGPVNVGIRQRTCSIAEMLNTWISWEYGRSPVTTQNASCMQSGQVAPTGSVNILDLFRISNVLDPASESSVTQLESALEQVAKLNLSHPALVLSQSTLSFAIFRRLRASMATLSGARLETITSIGQKGLEASLSCVRTSTPWWHTANVPFQFVCILLAIDVTDYLPCVEMALRTLRTVTNHFDTQIMHNALSTAEHFVQLSQKRKERDLMLLQRAMPSDWSQEVDGRQGMDSNSTDTDPDSDEMAALNEWLGATPSLEGVDWNQLWAMVVQ